MFIGLLALVTLSCSKKGDTAQDNKIDVSKVSGTYKGGTLEWTKFVGTTLTNGTDPNFTITVTYVTTDKVNITLNTVAPITRKTFSNIPLTNKIERTGTNNVITGGTYVFSANTSTPLNPFEYYFGFGLSLINNTISGSLQFNSTTSTGSGANYNFEQLTGSGNR